ncbi:phage tail family protein [Paenibacillus sp. N1-5-1-14]|uniref:phage tail family protein n=1 Tax=Paenibacillus radicibacter TaxID=2972488 RepID=UPI002159B11C|nr:phage tail family protein [Paenibacillus radicibacter]MCR8641554.1 phage tail family protein [Paenibacillus radicibacter]
MTTWAYLAKFKGYYTSQEISLDLDGDSALTRISWDSITPSGTSLTIQTNLSFDNGVVWQGWKEALNGGAIPDAVSGQSLKHTKIKYRVIQETNDKNVKPTLSKVSFYFEPVVEFNNKGDVDISPEIWITKIGNGDFTIINTTKGNEEFKFTGLIDGETVYVNNESEDIETSLSVKYRYKDFNDNYLNFDQGLNILKVHGNAKIQYRYTYKFL